MRSPNVSCPTATISMSAMCAASSLRGGEHKKRPLLGSKKLNRKQEDLDEVTARFVLAHELGHMQLHRNLNTVFMDTRTYNPHSRFERQANTFAVELLLPDDLLREYPDCSIYQLAQSVGVPEEFVEMKLL